MSDSAVLVGPLGPTYSYHREHRYYFLYRDGVVTAPEIETRGQCSDHRYATGLQVFIRLQAGDTLIRCEHSSHAGREEFSLLTLDAEQTAAQHIGSRVSEQERPILLALLGYRESLGKSSGIIAQTLRTLLGVGSVPAPQGW